MIDEGISSPVLPTQVAGEQYDWSFSPPSVAEGGAFSGRIRETVVLSRDATQSTGADGRVSAADLLDDTHLERGWSGSCVDDTTVEFTRAVRVQDTDIQSHCTNVYRQWTDAPPGAWVVENTSVETLTRDE